MKLVSIISSAFWPLLSTGFCAQNVSVSADFLAWFASEEVSSIWTDVISVSSDNTTWAFPSFDFKWDYGFRVKIARDLEHDAWDTSLSWTWFRTDGSHAIPPQENALIQPEFFAGFLSGANPKSLHAHWSLLFNMCNWELGRACRVSEAWLFRPFLGLQGGWIDQSIRAYYKDLIFDLIFPTSFSGKESLENNFWGIGPSGGVHTEWRMCDLGSHVFDLLGDLSLATMWGTWDCSDVYRNVLGQVYSVDTKKSSLGALMLKGFLGALWEMHSARGARFSLQAGFETQLWLSQLRISTFQLQRLHDDLTLQGVSVSAKYDF